MSAPLTPPPGDVGGLACPVLCAAPVCPPGAPRHLHRALAPVGGPQTVGRSLAPQGYPQHPDALTDVEAPDAPEDDPLCP